jgi:hypothetical protein
VIPTSDVLGLERITPISDRVQQIPRSVAQKCGSVASNSGRISSITDSVSQMISTFRHKPVSVRQISNRDV